MVERERERTSNKNIHPQKTLDSLDSYLLHGVDEKCTPTTHVDTEYYIRSDLMEEEKERKKHKQRKERTKKGTYVCATKTRQSNGWL